MTSWRRCFPDKITCHHHWGSDICRKEQVSPCQPADGIQAFPSLPQERECSPVPQEPTSDFSRFSLWLSHNKTLSRSMLPIGSPRQWRSSRGREWQMCAHSDCRGTIYPCAAHADSDARTRISGNISHNLVTYKSVRVPRLQARRSFKD